MLLLLLLSCYSHRLLLSFLDNQEVNDALASFERSNIVKTYKFGVLYRAAGQVVENDMFGNEKVFLLLLFSFSFPSPFFFVSHCFPGK